MENPALDPRTIKIRCGEGSVTSRDVWMRIRRMLAKLRGGTELRVETGRWNGRRKKRESVSSVRRMRNISY